MKSRSFSLVAYLFFFSSFAFAHQEEHYFDDAVTDSVAGMETTFSGFDYDGVKGSFITNAFKYTHSLSSSAVLGIGLPIHSLMHEGRRTEVGLGDVDLNSKFYLYGDGHFDVSGGLRLEIPTGNEDRGIGSGHFEFSPFFSAMQSLGAFMPHASLSFLIAPSHDHSAITPKINFVAPHAQSELRYQAGLFYTASENINFDAVLGAATVLNGGDPISKGSSFFAGVGMGYVPAPEWRISFVPQFPFGGNRRFTARATLGVDYLF